jgi:hypothetical protein
VVVQSKKENVWWGCLAWLLADWLPWLGCGRHSIAPASGSQPARIAPISLGGVVKNCSEGSECRKSTHPPTPDIQLKSAACDWDFALFSIKILLLRNSRFKDL